MQIDIILFDGFDELDAIAPYEVLRTAAELGAPIEPELVGAHGPATITASHGARLVVHRGPSETAGMVIVPGGGYFHACWPRPMRAAPSWARSARARCCSLPPASPPAAG
jgi:putative intracellular protease/amidase